MNVLIACEYSGIVSRAFANKGHNVTSCDLLPSEAPGRHIIGDVRPLLELPFDLLIGFPPCTFLCKAQIFMLNQSPDRYFQMLCAVEFFKLLYNSNIPRICLENPSGILTKLFMPPSQIIQPWHFGAPYRKQTGLWLKNLPPLISSAYSPFRRSVSNHVNSRMSQELKSKIKSRFFPEVAEAMAVQWS